MPRNVPAVSANRCGSVKCRTLTGSLEIEMRPDLLADVPDQEASVYRLARPGRNCVPTQARTVSQPDLVAVVIRFVRTGFVYADVVGLLVA